jgi:hypothetical protein
MTFRKLLIISVALAIAANTRVSVLPGWAVPFPALCLAIALAFVAGVAALLMLRFLPARPIPAVFRTVPVRALTAARQSIRLNGGNAK